MDLTFLCFFFSELAYVPINTHLFASDKYLYNVQFAQPNKPFSNDVINQYNMPYCTVTGLNYF